MHTNARENGIVLKKHAGGSRAELGVLQVQKLDVITEHNSGAEFEIKTMFIY